MKLSLAEIDRYGLTDRIPRADLRDAYVRALAQEVRRINDADVPGSWQDLTHGKMLMCWLSLDELLNPEEHS